MLGRSLLRPIRSPALVESPDIDINDYVSQLTIIPSWEVRIFLEIMNFMNYMRIIDINRRSEE